MVTAKRKTAPRKKAAAKNAPPRASNPKFPRHSIQKALRIPSAILEQHAGKSCTDRESAAFAGMSFNGPFQTEISSSIKYGLLERPEPKHIRPTELAKQILRPQSPADELEGIRKAVLSAPDVSSVYHHYRGENLPDTQFLTNTLVDKFGIGADRVPEFLEVFVETLESAKLIEEHAGKRRVLDAASDQGGTGASQNAVKRLARTANVDASDSCFVLMPFGDPHGSYYQSIFRPAIERAGLKPVRADADIFATGKVIDQIWRGVNAAKVLVAELTTRNPNVYYELGLAHALLKPVVLVSSNQEDVPFDLQHIRVIYYDMSDPFWGEKLINKVAENILSALNNPEEAIFRGEDGV